jgi:hypothetical protein
MLEPLADESESPRLYDYAIRVVPRVSPWESISSRVHRMADGFKDRSSDLLLEAHWLGRSSAILVFSMLDPSGIDFLTSCPTSYVL